MEEKELLVHLKDLRTRVQDLENYRAAHDARIDTLWDLRHKQDTLDAKQFAEIRTTLNELTTNLKVMQARMALVATIGGAIAAVVFQLATQLLQGG